MGISAALAAIQKEAEVFSTGPYLLSVDADRHPHCIPTTVVWADDAIVVRSPSRWTARAARGHRHVSLLWAADDKARDSLIVDGTAQPVDTDNGQRLSITPTRAVLHRSGRPSRESRSSCSSDCVPIFCVPIFSA